MKIDLRKNIEIILVQPGQPGNIGATCRAMNNMGFENLGLVKPVDYKVPEAYKFAWNSHHILESSKVYDSIAEAVKDKGFVIAMSCRTGKFRGHFENLHEISPEISTYAEKSKVAILFGCESWGLTNEDLTYANRVVKICTAAKYPSLNLAQAVLVTCYELLRTDINIQEERPAPADGRELANCFEHAEKVLAAIGYGKKGDHSLAASILKAFKRIAGRAVLDPREVRMIRGVCSQIEGALNPDDGDENGKK